MTREGQQLKMLMRGHKITKAREVYCKNATNFHNIAL